MLDYLDLARVERAVGPDPQAVGAGHLGRRAEGDVLVVLSDETSDIF